MALRPVRQENYTGCFIAGVAMLLGVPYKAAFAILHPGKDPAKESDHGFRGTNMLDEAFKALNRAGITGRPSRYKKLASFRRGDKHAILIIRWEYDIYNCHTIVYDGDEHRFYDPSHGGEITNKHTLKAYQRQLDCAIIIKSFPKMEGRHDLSGSDPANAGAGGASPLGQGSGDSDDQTPLFT